MHKIKNRVIFLMLISLIPILIILVFLNYKIRTQYYAIAEKTISHAIHEVKFFQVSFTGKTKELLSLLSQEDEVRQLDTKLMSELFANILSNNDEIYSNLFFCDMEGNVIASGKPAPESTNSKDRKYFTDALETGKFSTGEYIVGKVTNNPVFHFSYPVYNQFNTMIGVLVVSLNLHRLDIVFAQAKLPEGSFIRLLDKNGISLLRMPPDPQHYQTGSKLREDFWKKISTGDSESTFIERGSDGIDKFYSFISITTNESKTPFMYFLFGIPTAAIYKEANIYMFLSVLATSFAIIITILIFRHYSQKSITERIEFLCDLTKKNINIDSCYSGDNYQDELTKLIKAFFEMGHRIALSSKQLIKAKEIAEAANLAKTQFLATMSHEIRTPFNGIMSMLQLCESTELSPEQNTYVSLALESTRKLLALVNEVLDLARLEQGKEIVCATEFCLTQMLDDIQLLFQSTLNEKNISYDHHYDMETFRLVGDELKTRQILFNLIGNAVKATSSGFIAITVSQVHTHFASKKTLILFTISDTGRGIPDNQMELLFKPFTQIKGTYTQNQSGTGLGLSIVINLVRIMGGSLCLSSEEGKGTTVYIALPFHYSEHHDISVPVNKDVTFFSKQKNTNKLNVLLAEDEKINQIAIQHFAKKLGFAVEIANNGVEAMKLLEKNTYDLVLMDIQMPELDGMQTSKMIRASNATYSSIPIIALTAYAMPGDKETFLEAGMNDYLSKPIEFRELEIMLRKHSRLGQ